MKIGFLILNFNSWHNTEKLAKKVESFANIDYIVIVDNVSVDGSYKKLLEISSNKIKVISSEKNGGYSYGNNFGMQYCKSLGIDIVFISNPDVDIDEEDILLLLQQFEITKYSLLTGVQYEFDGTIKHSAILNKRTYLLDLLECCYLTRKLWAKNKRGVKVDYSQSVQPIEMFKGSFFGIRLSDFIDVGGFDENIFLYNEEAILARRMQDKKKKMGLVTSAKYYHMHAESVSRVYKNKADRIKLLYQSRLYYHDKYNGISVIKKNILKMAMAWSLLEFRILDRICYITNRWNRK